MPFHEKINISRVSCGFNFGFFISIQGLVYAVGKDNSDGQLGLGHRYPNDSPEIVLVAGRTRKQLKSRRIKHTRQSKSRKYRRNARK